MHSVEVHSTENPYEQSEADSCASGKRKGREIWAKKWSQSDPWDMLSEPWFQPLPDQLECQDWSTQQPLECPSEIKGDLQQRSRQRSVSAEGRTTPH